MSIWKVPLSLDVLNSFQENTLGSTLSIVFSDFGDDYLAATMPVTAAHVQPYRILHGGANVVLAETLGSVASSLCIPDLNAQMAVGVEINANHLRAVPEGGSVRGVCKPVRVGRAMHVWQIEIFDEKGRLSCISRLTTMIVPRKQGEAGISV
jgi:1,4-dihydroxy-2-naphthoyl-CoA hydrolase